MLTDRNRILTTHTGSLPRPVGVALPGTKAAASGPTAESADIAAAVQEVVRRQVEVGVDLVNDGEMSKPSYSTYVTDRLSGFTSEINQSRPAPGSQDFPEFFQRINDRVSKALSTGVCSGPVSYVGNQAVQEDLANLRTAMSEASVEEAFMTSASPGVIALFLANRYYASHEEYIWALADAMRQEYEAIVEGGLILQLDCPDLANWLSCEAEGMTKSAYLDMIALHVEAINQATSSIPPESMRMHICWGNYEGPHNRDIALAEIINLILPARPSGLLFEGANPRHEHEWTVFEHLKLPEDKVLIPGVIDSTTNYIEHPELVAQRIERYARIVGIENVLAGSDCGFATFANANSVDPRIAWAKLASLVEGTKAASRRIAAGHQ